MRISTASFYQTNSAYLSDLQASVAKTQAQVSSGLRLQTPSDDPVAAARVVELSQSQSVNSQQSGNRAAARDSLSQIDSTLSSVSDQMSAIKSQIVAAGNASLTDTERGYIATDLQTRYDQLIALANGKDGNGNYLFSGYQTNTQPFTATSTGATYNGDQGQRQVQAGSSRLLAVSETGDTIFQGGGQDIFKTLSDTIALLNTSYGGSTSALTTGLATANGNIDKAITNVSTVQASVGSRLNELDSLDNFGDALDTQYQKNISDLQGLDYTKAITQLSQQQVNLEAAQKSFISISGLSLFNYIST